MKLIKLFKRKKFDENIELKEVEYFILSREKDINKLIHQIIEYSEIYKGNRSKHNFEFYSIVNKNRETETIISIPEEVGIYNIVNLFGWISIDDNLMNVLICNNTLSKNRTFFAQIEVENGSRDTIIGKTNIGKQLYAYLPQTFSLDLFDVIDVGVENNAVDQMLADRGLVSIFHVLSERRLITKQTIELTV
ncbi:hypothetical protein [Oceanirhabdus sp. W0125-5]|uniref:hypothetical protein n=1 Tax=Oceanirhabdus sp. W0125-5 TaxID=2999116 RepID=UPI0022F2C0C7|nr:hypothetical protein [Oceanirhabdus sp. W0125-5]WBW99486.1 hypothetical protein OW730_12280 [Oceanirhabdus sp. W0125-5]